MYPLEKKRKEVEETGEKREKDVASVRVETGDRNTQ